MVELRVLASEDDWPVWRQARLAALGEAPHAFRAGLADWHHGGEQRWRTRLTVPGARNLVAVLDGRTVGMAAGLPGPGGTYELRSVWVSPRVRGRGVGDLLVEAVEVWAREAGAGSLRLAVVPGNEAAVALYLRNGFVASGELGELLGDGVSREQVMVKRWR
ncbi:N-acetyltransferase family protein [Streptomyces sp. BBFR102]|uniref:GNAT family N-acetyltransferase n=1 Tax=Streptomyces sp. BBFR102 TaxID=3448171 RepID=UPI003F534C35